MNFKEIEKWGNLLDVMEDNREGLAGEEVPPISIGEHWTDPDGRVWEMVEICYGAVGGRWCYRPKLGPVVADTIFNGSSPFFVGMLRIPYDGVAKSGLMIQNIEHVPQEESRLSESSPR